MVEKMDSSPIVMIDQKMTEYSLLVINNANNIMIVNNILTGSMNDNPKNIPANIGFLPTS